MSLKSKPSYPVSYYPEIFRTLLLFCLMLLLFQQSYAQYFHKPGKIKRIDKTAYADGGLTIPLWSDHTAPDGPGPSGSEKVSGKGSYTNISEPHLIVHQPEHPNGTAILVISGGGYAHIELGKESTPAADWLASQGITAFELVYRLPAEGWGNTLVPLADGQRAMRLIRSMSEKFGLNPNRIGIMGFSAGGHLAGMIATQPDQQLYRAIDRIDRLSARPDFAALIYPVITMLPPFNTTHAEKELLGKTPGKAEEKNYSVQLNVNDHTPPVFLAQAVDDPISNIENSRLMYAALQKYNISSELRVFPSGGHGWGMGSPDSPVHMWPELFRSWAAKNGFWNRQ